MRFSDLDKDIAVYSLTSELHNEDEVKAVSKEFLKELGFDFFFMGRNFEDYGKHQLNLIFVRTGGTEGIFKRLLPELQKKSDLPFYLLASDKSNSLAASMEILSYLNQNGIKGEILHGPIDYVRKRIAALINGLPLEPTETKRVIEAKEGMKGCRLGVIGRPSDWLISSHANYDVIKEKLGLEMVDIPMDELLENCGIGIYEGLKTVIANHNLQGFTLRCFDLLTTIKYTGCLALAKLNSEGIVAGCEGDIPTLITMKILHSLTGLSGFQANPASINPKTGEMLFAHCTIPLNMVECYELDTHFESGIGVAIRGFMAKGDVTIFKVSGDLSRYFIAEGILLRSESNPNLCRTQQVIRLSDRYQTEYFLTNPIGNHHVIIPGHLRKMLQQFIELL